MFWDIIKATAIILGSLWILSFVFNFLTWLFLLNIWFSLAVVVVFFALLIGFLIEITIRAWEEGR